MRPPRIGCWVLGVLALAGPAGALPPDQVVRLAIEKDQAEGRTKTLRAPAGEWTVRSSRPGVVRAATRGSAEVSLEAIGEGDAWVVFRSALIGQVVFWKVRVAEEEPPEQRPDSERLKGSCACGGGGVPLSCRVESEACVEALHRWLGQGDWISREIRLTYTIPGVQAVLRRIQRRLEAEGFGRVEVAFLGANLRVRGLVADEDAWFRVMTAVFEEMVGTLLLDDQLRIEKPAGETQPLDR